MQGKNKEIGIKGAFMDDRLSASLAWYHTYQDNVAVEHVGAPLPAGQDAAYYGADGVSAKGIEFGISGEIRPGLNLFFGAATMKQRNPDGSRAMTSLPSRTAKLFATWTLPDAWEKWTLGGGARWQNGTWTDVYVGGKPLRLDRPGYTVADAMVRYDIDERWSAQLNVNKLFDKHYYTWAALRGAVRCDAGGSRGARRRPLRGRPAASPRPAAQHCSAAAKAAPRHTSRGSGA